MEPDYKYLLLNLLARIHKDGGHYTKAVGIAKSAEEADTVVAYFQYKIDNARALHGQTTHAYHSLIGELAAQHDKLPDRIKVLTDEAICQEGL